METITKTDSEIITEISGSENDQFIKSNTQASSYEHLLNDCIIPVFAKDNESTISHIEFIQTANEVIEHIFKAETIKKPVLRVSHPIKGRIPEAMGKPAKELLEREKTIYYERMAFLIEIPSIRSIINDNTLCLTVGGVRAYNQENLYNKKAEEHFKMFIGFQNKVCTNLCVSTDGFAAEIKARTLQELADQIYLLLTSYSIDNHVRDMMSLLNYSITENQFAQLIGRLRMYQLMPSDLRKDVFQPGLSDTQVNAVVKDYFFDRYFMKNENGTIDLWRLFNLFTGANKTSYIDTFIDRGVNAYKFNLHLRNALEGAEESWFLS